MSAGHWVAKWCWSKGPWFSNWHCRLAGSGNGRELHLEETQGDFGRGAKVKMLQDIVRPGKKGFGYIDRTLTTIQWR